MILDWYRAKRAELKARRAYADAEARVYEALNDPFGEPQADDESDWIPIGLEGSIAETGHPQDRLTMLKKARALHIGNPTGRAIVETLVAFVVGDGFHVRAVAEDEEQADLAAPVQERVDDLMEAVGNGLGWDWFTEESIRRWARDGETFIHLFPESRDVRFLEPDDVVDSGSYTKAVITDADDALTVTGYRTASLGVVEADRIIHRKFGVDANVMRGLPLLYPVLSRVRKYDTWLDDLGTLIKLRTAIALIRKHTAAPSVVQTFADNQKTDTVSKKEGTLRVQKIRPGAIIDASGLEYEFKSPNVDASDLGEYGRFIMLNIASGVGQAEYMVSGDASNNNYASISVAETAPFERFRRYKRSWARTFQTVLLRLLNGSDIEVPEGVSLNVQPSALPVRDLEAMVKALSLARADGVLSKQSYMARLGLDYTEEARALTQEREEASAYAAAAGE